MKRTFHGSCHCQAITYEADIDLSKGTTKCNCTMCWKQRMWNAGHLAPSDFRLKTGADMLGDYAKGGDWGNVHHRFCTKCGIATHGHGSLPQMGGEYVSVHLSTLDDLPVEDLVTAPVHCCDGLHDDWRNVPKETRHL